MVQDTKRKKVIKNRITKNKKQHYYCEICNIRFIENYTYQAYFSNLNQQIVLLINEGLGIRSTARILKISNTTLLKEL
ncbi:IS1-like element transposase [Flavobacterium pectinovorum]|uniref:IS1-like element transposase n=1 Tax=Flavobacterium pectinovorum TaxID=29533 RepID=UPI002938D3F3|nr:IS1-like element transposase [Flavobacterium pectinovorum]